MKNLAIQAMALLLVKSVEVRSREEGDDFAIVKYANLKGSANRISNEPEVAKALEGQWVEGRIEKCDVEEYEADFDDGEGMQKLSVRNVAIFKGETIEEAIKASGHKPATKVAALPVTAEAAETEADGNDAERS
ncbi:MAG: hypothetical protein ABIA91_01455 [Patescibacteria group bacterium]